MKLNNETVSIEEWHCCSRHYHCLKADLQFFCNLGQATNLFQMLMREKLLFFTSLAHILLRQMGPLHQREIRAFCGVPSSELADPTHAKAPVQAHFGEHDNF